jgi:hypothetical protein
MTSTLSNQSPAFNLKEKSSSTRMQEADYQVQGEKMASAQENSSSNSQLQLDDDSFKKLLSILDKNVSISFCNLLC